MRARSLGLSRPAPKALVFAFLAWAAAASEPVAGQASVAERAAASAYPRILRLLPSDLVYKQLQDAIAQSYRASNANGAFPDLFFVSWVSDGQEDLFSLAARLSLPYEALATLNGISAPGRLEAGREILIPSVPGLFVSPRPRGDFEALLYGRLLTEGERPLDLRLADPAPEELLFYRDRRLYATERSFFLNVGFRSPLPQAVLSSAYGMRRSPIDDHDRFHHGIDLAAPAGTAVLAARSGTVVELRDDAVLGLMIVLQHEGSWRTVYGHLSAAAVELNQRVLSGTILGAVGSTGRSTGPHLHFEIRMGADSRDPSSLLPGMRP